MEDEVLKTNLLAIAGTGFLLLLVGVLLYVFRDRVGDNTRYVMSIPPLGVAAYVFVFNMFRFYDGGLTLRSWLTVREILLSTLFAAVTFGLFTAVLVITISILRR